MNRWIVLVYSKGWHRIGTHLFNTRTEMNEWVNYCRKHIHPNYPNHYIKLYL